MRTRTPADASAFNCHASVVGGNVSHHASGVHPLGAPWVDVDESCGGSIILLFVCTDGGVTRIGMPGGTLTRAFGCPIRKDNRDSCAKRAQQWADALLAPRDDVHVFYQLTVDEKSDHPLLVVAAAVSDPPPTNLEWGRVDTPDELSSHVGPSLAWAAAGLLTGRLYVAAGATIALLAQMAHPSEDYRQLRVTTGRLELAPVVMHGGTIRSSATKMDWAQPCPRALDPPAV